ncbi:MAG: hypothetical protein HPY51_10210 [Candidatus Omnitrophica bacterium]|nr:hypothetical protein [Candidatus Omnitrophota bacterium]
MEKQLQEMNRRMKRLERQNRFFKMVLACAAAVMFFAYLNVPVESEPITKQAETPKQIKAVLMLDEHEAYPDGSLIISPDSQKFAVIEALKLKIFDRNMNLILNVDLNFTGGGWEAMFSPDGTRFAFVNTRELNGSLKIWGFEESEAVVESFQIHEATDTGK